MNTVTLTAAQLSVLECDVGIFEPDFGDDDEAVFIRSAMHGNRIEVREDVADRLLEIANGFDSVAHYERCADKETKANYRRASLCLYRLVEKMNKASRAA